MIVKKLEKIILSILFLFFSSFNIAITEENVNDTSKELNNSNILQKKDNNVDEKINFKKRSLSITPYFGLSFIKQTYKYLGDGEVFSLYSDFIKRQQISLGLSVDTFYNINKTFAISAGISFEASNLFSSSSKGSDYYFDVDHYYWDGLNKVITSSNSFTIKPLFEVVLPFHFKIMFNEYISVEPYVFVGINVSNIMNKSFSESSDMVIIYDEIMGYVGYLKPDILEKKKKNIGLSTGCGVNLLFFKERVIVGAEYKYLENKAYSTKFMVDTFSMKFAYRFHIL